MAQDENVSVLMDSLRGANLNEDNFAKEVSISTLFLVQIDWRPTAAVTVAIIIVIIVIVISLFVSHENLAYRA